MFIVQPLRSHHVVSGRQVYLWRVSEHIMFEVNDTKQTQRGVIQQLDGFIISTLILSACMNTQRNVTAASLLCGDSYISCRWLTLKLVEVSAQDAKLVTQKTNLHKCLKICLATVWLHNMFVFFPSPSAPTAPQTLQAASRLIVLHQPSLCKTRQSF